MNQALHRIKQLVQHQCVLCALYAYACVHVFNIITVLNQEI